jgi:starch phosphorylase
MDGANVEIAEAVGKDNIFIFGADAYEIARIQSEGNYAPQQIYENDARIRRVVDCLTDGTLPVKNGRQFEDIMNALLNWGGGKADQYFILHDFASYADVYGRMMDVYAGQGERDHGAALNGYTRDWLRLAAVNTAASGCFFADRTIQEYNDKVWRLGEVMFPERGSGSSSDIPPNDADEGSGI